MNMHQLLRKLTSAEGYDELKEKIQSARQIRNTRFYPKGVDFPINEIIEDWDETMANCIEKNGLVVRDVGSNIGHQSMSNIIEKLRRDKQAIRRYSVRYYAEENFDSLNFIIIDFVDKKIPSELWLGWQIEDDKDPNEGYCFQSMDVGLIKLFRGWHTRLMQSRSAIDLK